MRHVEKPPAPTSDRPLGGYREADLDAALLRSERSDAGSVALRLTQIGLVHGLLAAAVQNGLPAQALVLPLIVELLAMLLIGSLLAAIVDCPSFRRSVGSLPARMLFAAVLLAMAAGLLASLPELGISDLHNPARVLAWLDAHGLLWPSIAAAAGLAIQSSREALQWRRAGGRAGGVFVWTAIVFLSTRIGVVVLLALFVGLPLALLLPGLGPALAGLGDDATTLAWGVWAALLLLDLATTITLALMHRDLRRST